MRLSIPSFSFAKIIFIFKFFTSSAAALLFRSPFPSFADFCRHFSLITLLEHRLKEVPLFSSSSNPYLLLPLYLCSLLSDLQNGRFNILKTNKIMSSGKLWRLKQEERGIWKKVYRDANEDEF